jgi:ligand-binding sensor domain-containing protein
LLLLLFLSGCGVSAPVFAQPYTLIDYTARDGLAGSTVYSMVQDKDGFLWFGTETGLSRFDGTHFRNFYMADGLPDNEIIKLFVDSRHRIWIIPFKHSICYYLDGKIHNQQNDMVLRKLIIGSDVVSVVEDSKGDVIISEAVSVHIISPDGSVSEVTDFAGRPFHLVQAGLNQRKECRFFVKYDSGIYIADLRNAKLAVVRDIGWALPNNYGTTYISPQIEIQAQQDSLVFIPTASEANFKVLMPKGFISISRINDSNITLNTYTKTFLFDIPHRKVVDSFLPGQTVSGAMQDAEGGLWFCTLGSGIHRLSTREVHHFSFRIHNTILPVFCIQKIASTFYIGTDRYYIWTAAAGKAPFLYRQIDDRTSRGRVMAILPAGKKRIIVGTDTGVFGLDTSGRENGFWWHCGSTKALTVLSDSTAVVFSNLGAQTIRLGGGRDLDTIWKGRSTCGCRQNGNWFIGTLNGLYMVCPDKHAVFLGDRYNALQARISAVMPTADGSLLVATYGEGLCILQAGRRLRVITDGNGLTSNICRCLYVNGNDIWVGTDKGLNKVTATDAGYKVTRYTTADGLSSDIINTLYVEGENVYAGTSDGMTWFNEGRLSRNSECLLRVTGLSISGRQSPSDTTDFRLPYNNNDLQFEYVGISFKSAGSIRYRYKLEGLDEGWKVTDQTFLHYPSLPPGTYELKIVAINKFDVSSNTVQIPFVIEKPVWEKAWFRVPLFLTTAMFIWLLFRYRLKRARKKEAERAANTAKITELEHMVLRSRMSPHFIFNCLNSIQLYVMDKDTLGASEFMTHFSRLIRQTLDISDRPRIFVQEEIDYLSSYLELERRRLEGKFTYKIFVAPNLDRYSCSMPPMILQPYVENAIWHGIRHRRDDLGHIRIGIEQKADYLVCTIEDNGVGRTLAAQYEYNDPSQHLSKGMELTAKRIEMLNTTVRKSISAVVEDIEDGNRHSVGTRVLIQLPI